MHSETGSLRIINKWTSGRGSHKLLRWKDGNVYTILTNQTNVCFSFFSGEAKQNTMEGERDWRAPSYTVLSTPLGAAISTSFLHLCCLLLFLFWWTPNPALSDGSVILNSVSHFFCFVCCFHFLTPFVVIVCIVLPCQRHIRSMNEISIWQLITKPIFYLRERKNILISSSLSRQSSS